MSYSPSPDVRFFTGVVSVSMALAVTLLFFYAWPEIRAWRIAQSLAVAPVFADCNPPTEHENLHIIVRKDPATLRFTAECRLFGSRGTYGRSRHGMPEPRP